MRGGSAEGLFVKRMKYTIVINQAAAVALGKGLDLSDMAILDYIGSFANSQACLRVNTPEGIFFWVSHKKIIDDMPLLGITTPRGIAKRIDKLIEADILRKHPQCDLYQKTLYTFGFGYDKVVYTPEQEFQPLNNGSTPPEFSFGGPLNFRSGDNTNSDYKFINNTESKHAREKKMLFRQSATAALVSGNDFSKFERAFADLAEEGVDLVYYYHAVADWSDSSDTKRTERGWGATIRNFVRGDMQKGCVRKVGGGAPSFSMEYLKGEL